MLDLVLFIVLMACSAVAAMVLADRRAPRLTARRGIPLAVAASGALGAAAYALSSDALLTICVAVAVLVATGVPQAVAGGRASS